MVDLHRHEANRELQDVHDVEYRNMHILISKKR